MSSWTRRQERGFSMLIVLMALMIMSIAGAAAISLGGADATAASGRFSRAVALSAAESGLHEYVQAATVSTISDDRSNPAGGDFRPTSGAPITIENIDIDGDGDIDYTADYQVWGTGSNPFIMDSAGVISQGRLLDPVTGSVMGTVWLGSMVRLCKVEQVGMGQKGCGPGGGGMCDLTKSSCDYSPSAMGPLGL